MADSSILELLEAERSRYILEAAELERRLQFIDKQMSYLDNLISNYAREEQIYSAPVCLSNIYSTQTLLQYNLVMGTFDKGSVEPPGSLPQSLGSEAEGLAEFDEENLATAYIEQESPFEENTTITNPPITQTTLFTTNSVTENEVDISNIPKLSTKRKPTSVPLLPEFEEYSVQNAILILMHRRPDRQMHIDGIVRDIYGDLPLKQWKTAKMNVSKALSTGVAQKMWYRVLGTNGVYTLQSVDNYHVRHDA